jgi:hypothetical protein
MFPRKFITAYAKYHATTLVLRLYEWICSHFVSDRWMDMLTMDTFAASKIVSSKMTITPQQQPTDRSGMGGNPFYVSSTMTYTAFWANILFTLSDYTIHQGLLCYAYYMYYQRKQQQQQRQRRRQQLEEGRTEGRSASGNDDDDEDDDNNDNRTMMTDLVRRSGQLFTSRGLGLLCCSVGAGIGTVVRPGWGTLMLSSMGEGAASTILDDGIVATMAALNNNK